MHLHPVRGGLGAGWARGGCASEQGRGGFCLPMVLRRSSVRVPPGWGGPGDASPSPCTQPLSLHPSALPAPPPHRYLEAIRRLKAEGKSFARTIHLTFVPGKSPGSALQRGQGELAAGGRFL